MTDIDTSSYPDLWENESVWITWFVDGELYAIPAAFGCDADMVLRCCDHEAAAVVVSKGGALVHPCGNAACCLLRLHDAPGTGAYIRPIQIGCKSGLRAYVLFAWVDFDPSTTQDPLTAYCEAGYALPPLPYRRPEGLGKLQGFGPIF